MHDASSRAESRGETVTVRRARSADGPAIGRLFARACRAAYTGILPDWFMTRYEPEEQGGVWTGRLAELPADRTVLVAARAGAILGFAHLGAEEEPHPGAPGGEVLHLFVDPGAVRLGAGRALSDAALAWFAGRSWTRATLWVFADNAGARAFYRAAGWRDTGECREEPGLAARGATVRECRYEIGTRDAVPS